MLLLKWDILLDSGGLPILAYNLWVQEVAAAEEQEGQLPWMPTIYLPTPQHSFVLKGLKAEVAAPALAPDLAPTFAPAFALCCCP